MYILAFNLNWFFTIPGILISLGVILLIIALILFITGYKKSKSEEKVPAQAGIPTQNLGVNPVADNNINMVGVVPTAPVEVPKFEEVQVGIPGVDPININTNVQEINPIQPQGEEIKIEAPEVVELDKTTIPIYNGVDPANVVVENKEEVPVTIYGGNDPLEATQKLPKVDEHHEPYGGAINNIQIIDPTDSNPVEVQQVEPVEVQTIETDSEPVAVDISSESVEIVNEQPQVSEVVPEATTGVQEEVPVVDIVSPATTEIKTEVSDAAAAVTVDAQEEVPVVDNVSPENVEVVTADVVEVEEVAPMEIPVAPIEIPSVPTEIPSGITEVSNEPTEAISEVVQEEVPVVDNVSPEITEVKSEHPEVEEL